MMINIQSFCVIKLLRKGGCNIYKHYSRSQSDGRGSEGRNIFLLADPQLEGKQPESDLKNITVWREKE